MSPDSDVDLEDILSGEASEEEVAAYNDQVDERLEERLDDQLEDMADTEQAAVEALLDDAEESLETATVEFPSGLEITVRTRMPPAVEHRLERLDRLEDREDGSTREIARVNCQLLASICESDGYDSVDVWMTAYEQEGIQWLYEMTDRVLEPVLEAADETGNGDG